MTSFNVESFRSYAFAAFASLYCSVMLLAISGSNSAHLGALVA
jgi:hypothetical protein